MNRSVMSARFIRGRRNSTELKKPIISAAEHRRVQGITGSAAEKNLLKSSVHL